jgi:hypothetical protein
VRCRRFPVFQALGGVQILLLRFFPSRDMALKKEKDETQGDKDNKLEFIESNHTGRDL